MDLDRPPHHRTPSTSIAAVTTTTSTPTAELFVCFTSRLSSSASMKLSKSILSPGRARDPSVSLSTSLSRRLRTNGSIKAGQASPMFPSSAKKRGSAFENPEPSSPKVTCIGQVRVKTKKKVKHTRSLSKRRSGDLSFRKLEQAQEGVNLSEERDRDRDRDRLSLQNQRSSSVHYQQQECHVPHRNQRWVHLPLTICEALRAFGAEFSCLFPCRSSCFSTNERGKEEKGNGSKESDHNEQQQEQRSCGAVFARWLVALQDGEGGKGREIELVVAGGDDEERIAGRPSTTMRSSRSRRHVFEDIDFKDESFQAHTVDGQEAAEEEEEKARVSICIPPKNALLLMRCRSDPMKMAALTNRFWETPAATKDEDSDGDGDEAVEVEIQEGESKSEAVVMEKECEEEEVAEQNLVSSEVKEEENLGEETTMEMEVLSCEQTEAELKPEEEEVEELELEVEREQEDSDLVSAADSQIDQQNTENVEPDNPISEQEVEEEEGSSIKPLSTSSPINSPERVSCETEENIASLPLEASVQEEDGEIGDDENTEEETTGHESESESEEEEEEEEEEEDEEEEEEEEEESESESDTEIENTTLKEELEKEEASEDESVKKVSKKEDVLPECLLLMMCEPKLSMEVSKETWVCSTDFIRWLPERQQVKVSKTDGSDDSKKRLSTDNKKSSATTTTNPNPTRPAPPPPDNKSHHLLQPPRSSCSLPPRSSCSLPAAAVSGVSMASMIEQKLVNAVGYEPFVLTRCKSEPMRTAATLAPEPCFWKNRKLEPHRRATFGFGAAGVGF